MCFSIAFFKENLNIVIIIILHNYSLGATLNFSIKFKGKVSFPLNWD